MLKHNWILAAILILAVVLRFYDLGGNPPALNWDEVSQGYNAYSIMQTGRDEWGQFLPWANFRAYGDYPLPMYMYLAMPGIALFGLNEFSVRIPSALSGSLTVLLAYLICKKVFKNKLAAVLSALLLAISPWSLLTSRQVLQATPAVFFFTLGVWLFLEGFSRKKRWQIAGIISLGLSAYTYHNTRILAPVMFVFLILLFKEKLLSQKKRLTAILITAAIFFIPLLPVIFLQQGSARAAWVGILDEGAINRINESRAEIDLPAPLPRLIENKVVYFIFTTIRNYLGYFSPQYLAEEGGTQYQFSVPHFGMIYPVELPFFYLGLAFLFLGFKNLSLEKKLLLGWLILAPLPAAVTRDSFQVVRSTTMLPAVPILTGFGLTIFVNFLRRRKVLLAKAFLGLFLVVLPLFFIRYFSNFWFVYPRAYSFAWQYGYKQVAQYITKEGDKYPHIVVSKKYGEPHEFLLFYGRYDPLSYRTDPNLVRYEKSDWFWVDGFNKFEFVNDWEVKNKVAGRYNLLLITSPGNYPAGGRVLQTVEFLDGKPAFEMVKY